MLKNIQLEYEGERFEITEEEFNEMPGNNKVVTFEAVVNINERSLSFVNDMFPKLEKMRLNNSVINCIRDIGIGFQNLRFISLAHCGLTDLSGIAQLSPCISELYLSFNNISDISEFVGLTTLTILDLEENRVSMDQVKSLGSCTKLMALNLQGNPASKEENYKERVQELIPFLEYLDENELEPKVKLQQENNNNDNTIEDAVKNDGNQVENLSELPKKVDKIPNLIENGKRLMALKPLGSEENRRKLFFKKLSHIGCDTTLEPLDDLEQKSQGKSASNKSALLSRRGSIIKPTLPSMKR